jgi:hypothetical protein
MTWLVLNAILGGMFGFMGAPAPVSSGPPPGDTYLVTQGGANIVTQSGAKLVAQ